MRAAGWLFGGLTAAAAGYYAGVIWAAGKFRVRRPRPARRPPISILKPLKGVDADLYDNLVSHVEQDYPDFELLFAAADADDPALAAAERLKREYPQRRVEIFVGGSQAEGNPKVALLELLEPQARHDWLLVNDADVRAPAGYLDALAEAAGGREVGLVTCPYRARPGATAAGWLDALWISADFAGQALLGRKLPGPGFALGATMLVRREDLARIGGFRALRPYLADDYQLGARIAALGRTVRFAPTVVELRLGDPGWRDVWKRHLRWARTVRASRPGGHFGLVVTFGILWSALLVAAAPRPATAALALGSIALRLASARAVGAGALQADFVRRAFWLAPLVELWSAAVWAASLVSRTVEWRGKRFRLDRLGRLERVSG